MTSLLKNLQNQIWMEIVFIKKFSAEIALKIPRIQDKLNIPLKKHWKNTKNRFTVFLALEFRLIGMRKSAMI